MLSKLRLHLIHTTLQLNQSYDKCSKRNKNWHEVLSKKAWSVWRAIIDLCYVYVSIHNKQQKHTYFWYSTTICIENAYMIYYISKNTRVSTFIGTEIKNRIWNSHNNFKIDFQQFPAQSISTWYLTGYRITVSNFNVAIFDVTFLLIFKKKKSTDKL